MHRFLKQKRLRTCLTAGRARQEAEDKKMKHFVYVLKSQKDGRLYKGMTKDVANRLKQHNSGETKSTKAYCPWVLVYTEEFKTIEEAVNREKNLKSGVGREFLNERLRSSTE